jgi:hypothetical protein
MDKSKKESLLQWLNERYDKELQWMNWAEHFVGKRLPSMGNFEHDRQMWEFLIALCESIKVDEHDNA